MSKNEVFSGEKTLQQKKKELSEILKKIGDQEIIKMVSILWKDFNATESDTAEQIYWLVNIKKKLKQKNAKEILTIQILDLQTPEIKNEEEQEKPATNWKKAGPQSINRVLVCTLLALAIPKSEQTPPQKTISFDLPLGLETTQVLPEKEITPPEKYLDQNIIIHGLVQQYLSNPADTLPLTVLTKGFIESLMEAEAQSKSKAQGIWQQRLGVKGPFGDPKVITYLLKNHPITLPKVEIDDPVSKQYKQLLQSGSAPSIISFLLKEQKRKKKTPFWKAFIEQQIEIFRNPAYSEIIATAHIQSIQQSVRSIYPAELENLSTMSYNMGPNNARRLVKILQKQSRKINLQNIERLIQSPEFESIITQIIESEGIKKTEDGKLREIKRTILRMKEAIEYVKRYQRTKKSILSLIEESGDKIPVLTVEKILARNKIGSL